GNASDVTRAQALLSDPDAGVRRAAAELVATRGPDQAATLLGAQTVADAATIAPVAQAALERAGTKLLASDQTRIVVLPTALGRRRVDDLRTLADAKGKDAGRLTAIAGLGRLGGDAARQTLEGILGRKGEPEEVRKASFRALRRLQRAEARARAFTQTH